MNLFKDRLLIKNPKVIIRKEDTVKNDFYFEVKKLQGLFYRVNPINGKEVFFLQALPKNVFVYVPEEGHGLIITLNLF
tara:strand:+ start:28102 stop:28335 length:234 start_codon:yes stop_codon:yes gene_type:complete